MAEDFITVMSETKSVVEHGPMQHLTGGATSFHGYCLFPSEAEAVSLAEADSHADRRLSVADLALSELIATRVKWQNPEADFHTFNADVHWEEPQTGSEESDSESETLPLGKPEQASAVPGLVQGHPILIQS